MISKLQLFTQLTTIICCYHHQRINYWFPMHMPQCPFCKLNARALNTRNNHLENQWHLKNLELRTTCYKLQVRNIIPNELQYIIVKRKRWWNIDNKQHVWQQSSFQCHYVMAMVPIPTRCYKDGTNWWKEMGDSDNELLFYKMWQHDNGDLWCRWWWIQAMHCTDGILH